MFKALRLRAKDFKNYPMRGMAPLEALALSLTQRIYDFGLTTDLIDIAEATHAIEKYTVDMSEQQLRQILDPVHFVEVTDSRGGVAPKEVARMIAERRAKLVEARKRNLARIEKLEKAREKLLADLHEFCENAEQPKP